MVNHVIVFHQHVKWPIKDRDRCNVPEIPIQRGTITLLAPGWQAAVHPVPTQRSLAHKPQSRGELWYRFLLNKLCSGRGRRNKPQTTNSLEGLKGQLKACHAQLIAERKTPASTIG